MTGEADKQLPAAIIPLPPATKSEQYSLQMLAKRHTEDALQKLVNLMNHAEDEHVQLSAANAILDRGWGKASVKVEVKEEQSLAQMQDMLLAVNDVMKDRIEEARRLEAANVAQYITCDAEVVSNPAPDSGPALPDSSEGGGHHTAELHDNSIADSHHDTNAVGETIYGGTEHSETAPNYGDDVSQRDGVQA